MAKLNDPVTKKIQVNLQLGYNAAFVRRARVINNEVQNAVNRKIDLYFATLVDPLKGFMGGNDSPPLLKSKFLGSDAVSWQPLLSTTYRNRKGGNKFFVNTGTLKSDLMGIQDASKFLGGYSVRSAKYLDRTGKLTFVKGVLQDSDVDKLDNLKVEFEVDVMGKLNRRLKTGNQNKFFDGVSSDTPIISVKLGNLFKSRKHYRDLVLPYSRYYTKFVLGSVVRAELEKFGG